MVELTLPSPPGYSLHRSVTFESDATRRYADGVLRVALAAGGVAVVWQRPDRSVAARVPGSCAEAGERELRFLLCLDDDHSPFLALARRDPLLRETLERRIGVRPMRVATVAHALLRALTGQLISAAEARRIENRLIRRAAPAVPGDGDRLHRPPQSADLARLSAADAEACGLSHRRAAALVRVTRTLDLERLRDHPTAAVVTRLEREPTLGPWSAGVVCLRGLGRYEHGLVGDLGLVRLHSALVGRPVEGWETRALLEPYGRWAGLASLYLLGHPLARLRGIPDRPDPRGAGIIPAAWPTVATARRRASDGPPGGATSGLIGPGASRVGRRTRTLPQPRA